MRLPAALIAARSGGAAGRFAHDQRVRMQQLARCAAALALTAHFLQQQIDRGARHRGDRLMNRRERRPDTGGDRRVVEAGDRQVLGTSKPMPVRERHRGCGHVVVGGEDRGRIRFIGQQPFRGLQARAIGEIALFQAQAVGRDAGGRQRGQKALQALLADDVIRVALDAAEAAMAERQQVFGQVARRGLVVDAMVAMRSEG